eukprot:4727592-Pyramimonas_sp.AAC.1
MRSISRAVWRQDRRLASRLLRYPLAQDLLVVRDDDRVALSDPARFSLLLDELQYADAESQLSSVRAEIGAAASLPSPGQVKAKLRKRLQRLARRA